MKRRTGICIFICVLLIVISGGVYAWTSGRKKPIEIQPTEQQTQEIALESVKSQEFYAYIIFDRDGSLSVYYGDNETLYMETGIITDTLPVEIQREVKEGMRFASIEELFDFLESYSS